MINKIIKSVLCLGLMNSLAASSSVYPIPQEMKEEGSKFTLKAGLAKWKGHKKADQAAVSLVKKILAKKQISVIIGESNDPGMKKYSKVPKNKEGYYLKISSKAVTLVGRSERGTYYAAQTLKQLVSSSKGKMSLPRVEIIDFPDVPFRGTVEGFYGKPWSHKDRMSQMRFYGKNKLNTYIYGPKDDPFHGFSNRWREPYPADKAEEMKELVRVSKENKVNFIWAVHPGADIKWVDKDGDGLIDDFLHCKNKFEMMYALGVRSFAVFFDDISGEGAKAEMQAKILNYLNREFVRKKGDVTPLVMCPTQYNKAWSGGNYLDILGTKMDKDIDIMWTGDSVCRDITRSSQDWINNRIKRKSYIWWNWPVSDYCRSQLLLGRTYGLDKENKGTYSGFVSNPMDKPEASKIALFGIADYCWNIAAFDSHKSWSEGIKRITPPIAKEMQIFANHNSDQGPNYHGYRREESAVIKPSIDEALKQIEGTSTIDATVAKELKKEFKNIRSSAKTILKRLPKINPVMFEEIECWLEAMEEIGKGGYYCIDLATSKKSAKDKVKLINRINQSLMKREEIGKKQKLKGHPDPWAKESKAASLVLSPFIKKVYSIMGAKTYKEITGKSSAAKSSGLFKAISNIKDLEKLLVERKGKVVQIKRILEVVTVKPNQYVGLQLPPGIFAKYVHVKLNNNKASTQGVLEISTDGKAWKELKTKNNGQEMHSGIDLKQKIQFVRYRNKSKSAIEIKLDLFKFDIPEDAKVNSYDAMFDGDLSSFFSSDKEMNVPNKKKKAKQVFIIGQTTGITVLYRNGKSLPYSKAHTMKKTIKAVKVPKKLRINEIIWK